MAAYALAVADMSAAHNFGRLGALLKKITIVMILPAVAIGIGCCDSGGNGNLCPSDSAADANVKDQPGDKRGIEGELSLSEANAVHMRLLKLCIASHFQVTYAGELATGYEGKGLRNFRSVLKYTPTWNVRIRQNNESVLRDVCKLDIYKVKQNNTDCTVTASGAKYYVRARDIIDGKTVDDVLFAASDNAMLSKKTLRQIIETDIDFEK